jgi:hypothetical protein
VAIIMQDLGNGPISRGSHVHAVDDEADTKSGLASADGSTAVGEILADTYVKIGFRLLCEYFAIMALQLRVVT